MKNLFNICAVLLLACTSPAWAYPICKTVVPSVTLSSGNIIIQRDLNVGELLINVTLASPSQQIYTCPGTPTYPDKWQNFGFKTTRPFTGLKSGNGNIYATSIPGIGFTLGASQGDATSVSTLPSTQSVGPDQFNILSARGNLRTPTASAKIRLYKTGPISSGALSSQIVGFFYLGNADVGWATDVPIFIDTATVTVLACTLNTPSIAIPLGDIQANLFTGVGNTLGTKSFNLGLNCNANTRVNVSMSGIQNTDTANTSVLALSGAGNSDVAKGVGAQILYDNTPMDIGKNLLLKTSAGGVETFSFQARYYQTLATVMPGKANATATLIITYQ